MPPSTSGTREGSDSSPGDEGVKLKSCTRRTYGYVYNCSRTASITRHTHRPHHHKGSGGSQYGLRSSSLSTFQWAGSLAALLDGVQYRR